MTLFLIMKRYDCSVRDHMKENKDRIGWKDSLQLLAQLLEGITHLVRHGIAHRDLKSDNLLLDKRTSTTSPSLVIADFGCCLDSDNGGLKMHYNSGEISRGGNAALMAPEVFDARPGPFTFIDYRKADVWAAGAITYELFGFDNPFYGRRSRNNPVPKLSHPGDNNPRVSRLLEKLVKDMLRRDPSKRLDAELAANICQVVLWGPEDWIDDRPETHEVLQWLLSLAARVYIETGFYWDNLKPSESSRMLADYQLLTTFLRRVSIEKIEEALDWIQHV